MKNILIVGAGITGAIFANKLKRVAKVTVIDKRPHTAGNIYLDFKDGIKIHKYGAHIFHTNNEKVWEFFNKYDTNTFVPYIHKVKAFNDGKYYTLPFNLDTLDEIGLTRFITPEQGRTYDNLEDYCINTVGYEIYERLIKHYTRKQWGMNPCELPASIIKRIPIRNDRDDRYFTDKYQGLFDYNVIINNLLNGVEVKLGVDFFYNREEWEYKYDLIVYSGAIDRLCDYKYGHLNWRCLRFENETVGVEQFQSLPVINYPTERDYWTRIIEHKNFPHYSYKLPYTIISKEYTEAYSKDNIPDYPVNTEEDRSKFLKYSQYAKESLPQYVLSGRLADYVYVDMHQAAAKAIEKAENIYNNLINL